MGTLLVTTLELTDCCCCCLACSRVFCGLLDENELLTDPIVLALAMADDVVEMTSDLVALALLAFSLSNLTVLAFRLKERLVDFLTAGAMGDTLGWFSLITGVESIGTADLGVVDEEQVDTAADVHTETDE